MKEISKDSIPSIHAAGDATVPLGSSPRLAEAQPVSNELRSRGWNRASLVAHFGIKEEAIGILLPENFEIDARDAYGRTPLSYTVQRGHEAVVKPLLEKNADTETKDTRYCWTPLSYAAERGHGAVVKLLQQCRIS